jgi:hypothetical protein
MPSAPRTPCSKAGCPNLKPCPTHRRQAEQARGTRYERGYGQDHRAIRDALVRAHIPGTPCPRCGQPMWSAHDLDAAHSTDLRRDRNAKADHLEHRGCNRDWRATDRSDPT